MSKPKKQPLITRASETDPNLGYDFICPHCGDDSRCYPYPLFCPQCGKKLED